MNKAKLKNTKVKQNPRIILQQKHMIQNQTSNYYQSPIISNPPVPSMSYANSPYYQQYYQQNYNHYYPYNYGQYGNQYGQCPQMQMPYQAYNNYPSYGGNCHCIDCSQYGLSINRQRLTPKFPQKLPYSFVTSGDRVEDKLVINQPTHESAPFQTQRRKTYVPYTRKYIDYQDYIQYVPVQKSEWQYQKVMKQIDYVPQQYYESSIEYIPQEKVQHKLQYLPVEQQVVHVPEQKMQPRAPLNISNVSKRYVTTGSAFPSMPVRNSVVTQVRNTNVVPVGNSIVTIEGKPQMVLPGNVINTQNYRRVMINPTPQVMNQSANIERFQASIRPAQSSVQMVPRSRLSPMKEVISHVITKQTNQNNSYEFPQAGGVMIGTSIPQNPQPQRISQNYQHEFNSNQTKNRIQNSQVLTSVLHNLPQQKEQNHNFDFRQSGKVFSEQFNIDRRHYQKKQSIVNRFQEDQNL